MKKISDKTKYFNKIKARISYTGQGNYDCFKLLRSLTLGEYIKVFIFIEKNYKNSKVSLTRINAFIACHCK